MDADATNVVLTASGRYFLVTQLQRTPYGQLVSGLHVDLSYIGDYVLNHPASDVINLLVFAPFPPPFCCCCFCRCYILLCSLVSLQLKSSASVYTCDMYRKMRWILSLQLASTYWYSDTYVLCKRQVSLVSFLISWRRGFIFRFFAFSSLYSTLSKLCTFLELFFLNF